MISASLIPSAQADALLRELRRQTRDETANVARLAGEESRAIVGHAHAEARARMHNALMALRQEAQRRLVRARAQAETGRRLAAHRRDSAAIDAAWPLLEAALMMRWQEEKGRRAWLRAAVGEAMVRLRQNQWQVEHPAGWSDQDGAMLRELVAASATVDLDFVCDDGVSAGVRIRAGQVLLDATPAGLLADRAAVAARLLAEVERGAAGATRM